jgi:hypothetical protein
MGSIGERNFAEKIKRPGESGSYENEESISRLGEKRISELDSQRSYLEQDGGKKAGGFNAAIHLAAEKFESIKEKFGLSAKLKDISERAAAFAAEAKAKIIEIMRTEEFNQIADATPFISGTKRVIEGFAGETLAGKKLSNKERIKHGAEGAANLGLDLTEVGEVEKGKKLAHVGRKIAGGIKENPDALKSLGKKIIFSGKEN